MFGWCFFDCVQLKGPIKTLTFVRQLSKIVLLQQRRRWQRLRGREPRASQLGGLVFDHPRVVAEMGRLE